MVAGEITGMEEKQMKDEIFDRKIKELADSYSEVPSPDLRIFGRGSNPVLTVGAGS